MEKMHIHETKTCWSETQMYWITGRKSQLTHTSLQKAMWKPVWTNGIQLCTSAENSNLIIFQRFQNKVMKIIVYAPRYVPNNMIQCDLDMPTIQEEIKQFSINYHNTPQLHPNDLVYKLLVSAREERKLTCFRPLDLTGRFN